ncbi:MAG: hypothetical protein AB1403_02475 [Candidatus Riflebacteria bacterium]
MKVIYRLVSVLVILVLLTGCGSLVGDEKMKLAEEMDKNGDILRSAEAYRVACEAYEDDRSKASSGKITEIDKKLEKVKEKLEKKFSLIISAIAQRTFDRDSANTGKVVKFSIQQGKMIAEKIAVKLGKKAQDRYLAFHQSLEKYGKSLESGSLTSLSDAQDRIQLLNELYE